MKSLIFTFIIALTLGGIGRCAAADLDLSKLPAPAKKAGVTYSKDVKTILDDSCVRCHGAEKPKARLRLDTREDALKGGANGKVILPGKSAESPMVHSVGRIGDPDYHMPPKDNRAKIPPLTSEQVALIRAWIDQGAK